jgi:hypothetical protein
VADRRVPGNKLLINEMRGMQASDERLQNEANRERLYDGSSARQPCVADGHARNYCGCIAMPTPKMVLSATRQYGSAQEWGNAQ